MKIFANDLFRSLAFGFLLGSVGMAAVSAAGPAQAAAILHAPASQVSQ